MRNHRCWKPAGATAALLVLFLTAAVSPAHAASPVPGSSPNPGASTAPAATPAAADAATGEPLRLSLAECFEIALKNNLDVEVARFTPQISETNIQLAWGRFDPSVYLAARAEEEDRIAYFGYEVVGTESAQLVATGIQQTFTPGTSVSLDLFARTNQSSDPFSEQDVDSWYADGRFSVTQPLLKNFGIDLNKRDIYIAQNNVDISNEQFRADVIRILTDVQVAYWDLVLAIGELEVQQTAMEAAQDLLDLNRTKVEVGALPPIEITTAEAEVASREVGIINAENNVRRSKDTLRDVLNLAGNDITEWMRDVEPVDSPEYRMPDVDWQAEVAEAMENSPTLEQARIDLKNKSIDIEYRHNQLKPDLSLEAGYGQSGLNQDRYTEKGTQIARASFSDALKGMLDGDLMDWYVLANLSLPLRNRTAKASYSASKLQKTKSELELRALEQQVIVDVRSAVRALEASAQSVVASEKAVKLGRERLEAEQKKFENGLSTSYNVVLMQEDLVQRQNEYLNSLVIYEKAVLALEAVKGTMLDYLGIKMVDEESE